MYTVWGSGPGLRALLRRVLLGGPQEVVSGVMGLCAKNHGPHFGRVDRRFG